MQDTKIIKLVNGGETLVDEQDYEKYSGFRWFRDSSGYANRQGWTNRKRWTIWLHREINQTPPHLFTDHINRNKLDNRRCNLRTCNKAQNAANFSQREGRLRGVSFHKLSGLWRSRFCVNGKETTTYHKTVLDAAAYYNEKIKNVHGEFGSSNKLPEGYVPAPKISQKRVSKFRGVGRHHGSWTARIYPNGGKEKHLGAFTTEQEAAEAYNAAAKELYGDRAKLNVFPT